MMKDEKGIKEIDNDDWYSDSIKWHKDQIEYEFNHVISAVERINQHKEQIKKIEEAWERIMKIRKGEKVND